VSAIVKPRVVLICLLPPAALSPYFFNVTLVGAFVELWCAGQPFGRKHLLIYRLWCRIVGAPATPRR
jgi:hypothetical protein